jgi:discoidin domain receptor family protein 2
VNIIHVKIIWAKILFRLHSDSSGGAWCPAKPVSRDSENTEYLEVDLGSMHVISKTLTQGRFGNGRGQEYAEAYKIQYWRPGMVNFIDYRDSLGRMVSYK